MPVGPLPTRLRSALAAAIAPGAEAAAGPSQDGDILRLIAVEIAHRLGQGENAGAVQRIAHLGVLTRPDARGRGLGASVVTSVALHSLRAGYLPQYRVLALSLADRDLATGWDREIPDPGE